MEPVVMNFDRSVKPSADITSLLVEGENVRYCFSNGQDVIVFTDRRIIIDDKDGLLAARHDLTSIPYRSIIKWHTVNAAAITDTHAVLEFWTLMDQYVINTDRSLNLQPIHQLISSGIL